MRVATHFATLAAISMMLGLMRWPSVHWELAKAYVTAAPDQRLTLDAIFLGLNRYLGNYIGEFIGELCVSIFFLISGAAMLRAGSRFPRWQGYLGIVTAPVYCTKIASRLVRTFTDRHGLKDLCRDLLGVELSKQQQSSDWGSDELTPEQLRYAASDVLYLHALKAKLDEMLRREGREALAQACYDFLPARAALDLGGWSDLDIFAH